MKDFYVEIRLKLSSSESTEDVTKKLFAAFGPGDITEIRVDGEER